MALERNEVAIKNIVEQATAAQDAIEKCKKNNSKDCDSEKMSKNLEGEITRIINRELTGQEAGKVAAKVQADILSELSQQAYSQKIPVSSYRMSRGSVEHGQFWSRRSLILNFVKAAGPFLTGFTPFFHVLNHRNNFSEGINIFSDPFEKGIELVFPDETVRQLQRLDEQMLRDGLTILNNQQVRTRAFIPKKLLGLDKNLRDDWPTVTQALGTLVIIGDKIQYINRIQVTSVASTEVKPPPTINNIGDVFLIGKSAATITITGHNMDQVEVRSNDDKVKPTLKAISSTTADLTITLENGAQPGNYKLIFDSPTGTVVKPIIVDYPVATVDLASTKIPQATFSPTKEKHYPLHIVGTNLYRPLPLTLIPSGPSVGEPTVSKDGTTLDAEIIVPAKAPVKDYELTVRTQTLAKDKDQPATMKFTIGPQPAPTATIAYEGGQPPTANGAEQKVKITITGENLDGAKIKAPDGFHLDDVATNGTNADPQKLETTITIDAATKGQASPFRFELRNSSDKTNFDFVLKPQPQTPGPTPPPEEATLGRKGHHLALAGRTRLVTAAQSCR